MNLFTPAIKYRFTYQLLLVSRPLNISIGANKYTHILFCFYLQKCLFLELPLFCFGDVLDSGGTFTFDLDPRLKSKTKGL